MTSAKMVVVCRLYDENIPVKAVEETLAVVDLDKTGLDVDSLYNWVCLMFGDCEEVEFIEGVSALGDAASSVAGMDFLVGDVEAFT